MSRRQADIAYCISRSNELQRIFLLVSILITSFLNARSLEHKTQQSSCRSLVIVERR
jgi:hypothetical protein